MQLKNLKIEKFIKLNVSEMSKVLGGEFRHEMSSFKDKGQIIATDSAGMTCSHGPKGWSHYDGTPGDGHASDWTNGKWSDGVTRAFPGDYWV